MSLVMKKSLATAKRVISGMENMSMNCFTFGPFDRKYILMLHTNFCLFTRHAENVSELAHLTSLYLCELLNGFLIIFVPFSLKPSLTKRLNLNRAKIQNKIRATTMIFWIRWFSRRVRRWMANFLPQEIT